MITEMLRLAADTAMKSIDDNRLYLVGAVAIRHDGAIVKSHNGSSYERFPRCHAEYRLMRKAGKEATVFVARVARKTHKLSMARPCRNCETLLRQYRAKVVYYSITEYEYGVIRFADDHEVIRSR